MREKNKYSAKRFWFAILSVFPGAVLFLIGVLWSSALIPLLIHRGDYKTGQFRTYGSDPLPSGGAPGTRTLVGAVNGVKTTLVLGISRRKTLEQYVPDTAQVKNEEVYNVWYREGGEHALHRTGQGFAADFNRVFWQNVRVGMLLMAPFVLSVSLYLYYRRKEKQPQKTHVVS